MESKAKIYPTHYVEQVSIALEDFGHFEELFHQKNVYSFYVRDKKVDSGRVIFGIRAMRINEFIDLLTQNNIDCQVLDQ
jgi:hypothetical protein